MIFETDKFEFDMGKVGVIHATNGFKIEYTCGKEDCIIKYGHVDSTFQTITKNNEEAENFIVNLIQKNIKDKGAKIEKVARGKKKESTYLSIMETLI